MEYLHTLLEQTIANLKTNEFFQGGFVIALIGAAFAYFRLLPSLMKYWSLRHCFIYVEIQNSDPLFYWITEWLGSREKDNAKRTIIRLSTVKPREVKDLESRNGMVDSPSGESEEEGAGKVPKIYDTPGYGSHLFRYHGALFLLSRHKEEAKGLMSLFNPETLSLRVARWRRKELEELKDELARRHADTSSGRTVVYESNYSSWCECAKQSIRPLESIIVKESEMDRISHVIEDFLARKDYCREQGIPWTLTLLLFGPAGTGKTVLTAALAGKLGCKVANLHLGHDTSDQYLRELFRDLPDNSIVSAQDLDDFFKGRKVVRNGGDSSDKLTFNGFINVLEGIAVRDGQIIIATANNPKNFDIALTRRFNDMFEIGFFGSEEVCRMFKKFYPNEPDQQEAVLSAVAKHEGVIRPSFLQNHIVNNRFDMDKAIATMSEVLTHKEKEFDEVLKNSNDDDATPIGVGGMLRGQNTGKTFPADAQSRVH